MPLLYTLRHSSRKASSFSCLSSSGVFSRSTWVILFVITLCESTLLVVVLTVLLLTEWLSDMLTPPEMALASPRFRLKPAGCCGLVIKAVPSNGQAMNSSGHSLLHLGNIFIVD